MPIKNAVKNINSQCQVVIFNWKNKIANDDLSLGQLSQSEPLDISKYVVECSFSKSLGAPAGAFELTLPNDRDWKQVIQRGCWALIYLSQDGGLSVPKGSDIPDLALLKRQSSKLRGMVFIERVAPKGITGSERGEFDVTFQVSGRDFGVTYEENEIFYNRLFYEGKIQDAASTKLGIQDNRNTKDLLTTLHQAFFSPKDLGIPGVNDSLVEGIPLQWILPNELIQAMGLKSRDASNYYGSIEGLLNFEKTLCSYPVENPMTIINGKAWDRLKSYSLEPFHELYTELDDAGAPRLNFRYIPWKTSSGTSLGELNQYVKAMSDLPRVKMGTIDLIDFDLGEDTHSRYNYFFTVVDTSQFSAQDSASLIEDRDPTTGFPRIQKNSVRRNGLRVMYTTVNALIQYGTEQVNKNLLVLHNELMFEYWNNSVFFESGTIMKVGSNDVKVGKVLEFEAGAPYNGGKIFYIEGYTDTYTVSGEGAGLWTQSLTLTRGMYPDKLGERGEEYTDNGEFTEDK